MNESRFDAFISYSRNDSALAKALQDSLQSLNRPWYRRRAMRVFRDQSSMAFNPALWDSVLAGLSGSDWLIVVSSPNAVASPWVDREVRWWLDNHGTDRLLLVIAGGNVGWIDADGSRPGGFTAESTVPAALRAAFTKEPRWFDVRSFAGDSLDADSLFRQRVADLAAPIHDIPRDDLLAQDRMQHRRRMQTLVAGVVVLAVLLVASGVATVIAVNNGNEAADQRDAAEQQSRVATARQLSATAVHLADSDMQQAVALATQAYRMNSADPQTEAAVHQVIDASPHLVGFLDAGADVQSIAGTPDAATVVAGTHDGTVVRWDGADHRRSIMGTTTYPIVDVEVNADASVVIAASTDITDALAYSDTDRQFNGALTVWDRSGSHEVPLPADSLPAAVAISPSGRTVLVRTRGAHTSTSPALFTVDLGDYTAHRLNLSNDAIHPDLALPDDTTAVTMDGGYGSWSRIDLTRSTVLGQGSYGFGLWDFGFALSPDGGHATYTNGAPDIWSLTLGADDLDHPERMVSSPVPRPTAMAMSTDGDKMAMSADGKIYVASSYPTGTTATPAQELAGAGTVNQMRFLAQRYLLSDSKKYLALWDLDKQNSMVDAIDAVVPSTCGACGRPYLAVSPSGARALHYSNDSDAFAQLIDFSTQTAVEPGIVYGAADSFDVTRTSAATWLDDDHVLLYSVTQREVAILSGEQWKDLDVVATLPNQLDDQASVSDIVADGGVIRILHPNGTVLRYSPDRSVTIVRMPVEAGITDDDKALALSPDGSRLVLVAKDAHQVRVIETSSGLLLAQRTMPDAVVWAEFVGDEVLVSDRSGIRWWSPVGDTVRSVAMTTAGFQPTASADGSIMAFGGSNEPVSVIRTATGTQLESFDVDLGAKSWTSFGFNSDGSTMVMATPHVREDQGKDMGAIRRVAVGPQAVVDYACRIAGGPVDPDQWRALTDAEQAADACPPD